MQPLGGGTILSRSPDDCGLVSLLACKYWPITTNSSNILMYSHHTSPSCSPTTALKWDIFVTNVKNLLGIDFQGNHSLLMDVATDFLTCNSKHLLGLHSHHLSVNKYTAKAANHYNMLLQELQEIFKPELHQLRPTIQARAPSAKTNHPSQSSIS